MKLSEINIYPIKSMGGSTVDSAVVEDRGLSLDRRWMLVDERGKFLTQREFPAMAAVELSLGETALQAFAGSSRIDIPLEPEKSETISVKIWSSTVRARPYSDSINTWFCENLGFECSLVLMPPETRRRVNPFYAVRKFKDTVSFADGYPFLLTGEASLAELNSRLETKVPMNRFRPNFVISGAEPFEEDSWKRIRIGETVFHVVKPCGRCVITTIDQKRGEKTGAEPLKTLAGYRTRKGKVIFGQNLIADRFGGTVRTGDEVEIIELR